MIFKHTQSAIPPVSQAGGKAANLHRLQEQCRVPAWLVVPVAEFYRFLAENALAGPIGDRLAGLDGGNAAATAAGIGQLIKAGRMPAALRDEIAGVVDELFGGGRVAVRSSAADEDGAAHSFAGIHESFLHISGIDAIIDHIRRTWASGYDQRALLYRRENRLPLHPVPMAVIVQRMIEATASGVAFTADPLTGDPHKVVVSALYGLGEGLVSAGLDADQFDCDKRTGERAATLACKTSRMVFDAGAGGGIRAESVPEDLRLRPSLSPARLDEVVATALAIERRHGRPQDIEFCFDAQSQLHILQTRDITTVREYGPAAGHRLIWDNSNIIESYSGVTSPMTFSFIRHAYTVVYHCFSEVMGIPARTVARNEHVYRNMLGLFQGQVYYNLVNWYRLVQQFPGYEFNKQFLESMMGVKDTVEEAAVDVPPAGRLRRYLVELPKLLLLAARMLVRFARLRRDIPAFQRHFDRHYDQWSSLDFTRLPPHELMAIYHDMERRLLRNWRTPIVNDFHVMVFYGILKACCRRWCGDANGTLQNNLICGEGEIASTAPTHLLMRLAARIKKRPGHAALFATLPPAELMARIPQNPDTEYIAEAVRDYLAKYGFRCMNELKLEEPSLHETPEFVYQLIANYVRMDDKLLDVEAMAARERQIRSDAETTAYAAMSWLKRPLFTMILRQARAGVRNRENMRFARTRIYGLLRQLLNAVGGYFAREDILAQPADIYFLAIDDVWDYLKGTAITTDLKGLAALRKAEFAVYRAAADSPDDHFETYGPAYHRNLFRKPGSAAGAPPGTGADGMQGIGCSPGIVEGEARVIHSPRDDVRLNGEILVAGRTDPGWVPLYPSVSGILIERGSILSHSAIVAREMGIPAVVGIPNLLAAVNSGDRLHMDGTTGRITVIARAAPTP